MEEQMQAQKPVQPAASPAMADAPVEGKKKAGWLKWLIIILVIAIVGIGVWFWLM